MKDKKIINTKEEAVNSKEEKLKIIYEKYGKCREENEKYLDFKAYQLTNGSLELRRVFSSREAYTRKHGLTVYIEPTYKWKWISKPVTFDEFIEWRIKQ